MKTKRINWPTTADILSHNMTPLKDDLPEKTPFLSGIPKIVRDQINLDISFKVKKVAQIACRGNLGNAQMKGCFSGIPSLRKVTKLSKHFNSEAISAEKVQVCPNHQEWKCRK